MAEVTIAGKRVTFRERVPLKLGARLPKLAGEIDGEDFSTVVPVLQMLIESWEFEGDPADAASYDELDLFGEMIPLSNAMGTELTRRMADMNPKASASASSSA